MGVHVVRAKSAWVLTVLALIGFGVLALSPVKAGCTLSSEPYGSHYVPSAAQHTGQSGGCGEERMRFQTWIG
ncbi:hypothetical protein [Streptomyces sp. NPDC029674]|uniref:hypothetical protein n=1 Tax=Streptomyces sp. NPDC029674 TaxID=3365297 RepID=UPI00384FDE3A